MKTYTFWVTIEGKGPLKVAEDGRTANEAKQIVEARFPGWYRHLRSIVSVSSEEDRCLLSP